MPPTDDDKQALIFLGGAFRKMLEMAKKKKDDETGPEFIKKCCRLLSAYGAQTLHFEYDGSGDSGDFQYSYVAINQAPIAADAALQETSAISEATIEQARSPTTISWDQFIADRRKEKNPLITPAMCEQITDELFELLPGGWEINDGSFGEIVIDVASETISIEHNERYTEVHTNNYSF